MRAPLVSLAVLGTTTALLGSLLGYHHAGDYLAFWTLTALAAATGWTLTSRIFASTEPSDFWILVGVLGVAVVVGCGLVLGSFGRISTATFLAAEAACFGSSVWLTRRLPRMARPTTERPAVPLPVVALIGALLAFAVAFGITHAPLTLYDSLSYHLFFPARWLQEGRITIIPTPFSDEAQAYAPGNGELFFLWLMLPFHGDFLARIGQLPFALLASLTLYALARRLGARPHEAVYPPALFLLARPVLEQTVGANVDLVCAALCLTSLYLGAVAVDDDKARDWVLWGVSLGLYAGSKYVALVYMPVFVLLAIVRGPRVRMLWALPGVALFGLPWYLRNWAAAGSPIYPATLQVGGLTIARGAFTRAAMLNTVFHTGNLRLLPVIVAHAFGPTLLLFCMPFVALGAMAMIRRGWWPHGFLALVPALMLPLFWFGLPVNIDSRFLLPAIGPALLPVAFVFRPGKTWNTAMHAALAAGMVWILVGVPRSIPAALPWFMDGWLALNGLLTPMFRTSFAAVAALIGAIWWISSRAPRWSVALCLAVCAGTATELAVNAEPWCPPSKCDYLDVTSPSIRGEHLAGWRWVSDHIQASTIAYAGINLPYPLTGNQLTNRVVYANIDGHPSWRFHDYARAYRAGFLMTSPALAVGSGELMPAAGDDAARPRYERLEGYRDAWIRNLRTLGITHLFVSALSAYEVDYVWHNEQGFPVEDDWARAGPRMFQLVYENVLVRIYAVDMTGRTGA